MIAIDPSINNVGIATWSYRNEYQHMQLNVTPGSLVAKGKDILNTAINFEQERDQLVCVLEFPTFMTAQRGKIAAQKGYTIDLGFLLGFVAAQMHIRYGYRIILLSPNHWKGTQPKSAIGKKFQRLTGEDYTCISDHEFEAVMLLDYYRKNLPTTKF